MKSFRAGFHARIAALIAVAAVLVLAFCDPVRARFYPVCPLHQATGLHCPGCGATRASHLLLRGDVSGALGMNALFVVALVGVGVFASIRVTRAIRERRPPDFAVGDRVLLGAGIVLIVFGVVRNLPFEPFHLLAP